MSEKDDLKKFPYVHKEYTSVVYTHIINSDMKGSIKMKKHYVMLTAVITSLILVLFVILEGVYTYESATRIMNEKWHEVVKHEAFLTINDRLDASEFNSELDVIPYLYDDFKYNSIFKSDDIGCYEAYICDDGKKIESGDYVVVKFVNKTDDKNIEKRYIPVGSDFKSSSNYIWNFSTDAMCDDYFIFNGKFKYVDTDYNNPIEYTIGENELASAENAVSVSEWNGDNELYTEYVKITETKYEEKLCGEARKKLEEVIDKIEKDYVLKVYTSDGTFFYKASSVDSDLMHKKIENGQVVSYSQKKLDTSYYISHASINSTTDNAYIIYLFHPLEIAFRNNIKIYIISLILFIILEAFVVIMMRKMYKNRMSYELMRQDLTRSIAHDLKTPLAVTKAYTENWEYIDEDKRHEYAEKLNSEVNNMSSLINNMLNMSKLDSKKEINLEEVELSSMTSAILEKMKPIISERELDVNFITDIKDGEYYAYADPKMIRIVISNFITNAVKYADSKIKITLLSNEKKVTLMVTNDGPCISKKNIKRIWEPFYKGDEARTDRIGSSGMGLAINSSILKLHKAKYKCISDIKETIFWFELKKVNKNGK